MRFALAVVMTALSVFPARADSIDNDLTALDNIAADYGGRVPDGRG